MFSISRIRRNTSRLSLDATWKSTTWRITGWDKRRESCSMKNTCALTLTQTTSRKRKSAFLLTENQWNKRLFTMFKCSLKCFIESYKQRHSGSCTKTTNSFTTTHCHRMYEIDINKGCVGSNWKTSWCWSSQAIGPKRVWKIQVVSYHWNMFVGLVRNDLRCV
jgi:hypothetical protein